MGLSEVTVTKAVRSIQDRAAKQASQRRVAELRARRRPNVCPVVSPEDDWSKCANLAEAVQTTRAAALKEEAWEAYLTAAEALLATKKPPPPQEPTWCPPACVTCGDWQVIPTTTKPEPDEVRRLGLAARREAALGWSRILKRTRPGDAAKILGEVLLDDDDADVWTARAAVFADALTDDSPLGARLLVEMHLEKAALLDPVEDDAFQSARDKNDRRALESSSPERPEKQGPEDNDHDSDSDRRRRAVTLCSQGDAYMREQFLLSAATKYHKALAELGRCRSSLEEDRYARIACHLNIAACYALRGLDSTDDALVIQHTTACLDLDDSCVPALLRRSDAYKRQCNYARARTDLLRGLDLLRLENDKVKVARALARLKHLAFLESAQI